MSKEGLLLFASRALLPASLLAQFADVPVSSFRHKADCPLCKRGKLQGRTGILYCQRCSFTVRAPYDKGQVAQRDATEGTCVTDPETGEPVPHTGGTTHFECWACELEARPGASYVHAPPPAAAKGGV